MSQQQASTRKQVTEGSTLSTTKQTRQTFLKFRLDADDSGWPPVGSESIPVIGHEDGTYEVAVPPLFVKGISVGDCISADVDDENYVRNWSHRSLSKRSTIWILKGNAKNLEHRIDSLRKLGCNIERLTSIGLYAIDVPRHIAVSDIDDLMSKIEMDGGHIAYPSFRH